MNTLDRMIAAVSPQRAVKRAAARRKLEILDSGYSNYGASQTKKSMLGWLYGGGSAKRIYKRTFPSSGNGAAIFTWAYRWQRAR